jgi:hypothetical protein
MYKNTILASIVAVLAVGCASIDHSVTRIDTNVFSVTTDSRNGGSRNQGEVTKAHLQAAAAAAKTSRCAYFAAIDNTTQNFAQVEQDTTGDTFVRNKDGSVQYRTAQGQQYKIVKPSTGRYGSRTNTYVCFADRPTAMLPGLIFNADLVTQ